MAASSSYATCLIGLLIFLFAITSSTATRDVKALDFDAHFDANKICSLFNAMDAKNTIMGLYPKAVHAQRVHLKFCQQLYDPFLQKDLKSLSQLLGKKDYTGLHREAGIFIKYASDCEESFKPGPSPLKLQNMEFFNGIDMISAFSYLLIHQ
ncbi:hypothetical protein MKW92_008370 [Papaver armeniacum]|nr:hypothetical protein MKW92_008370 [Papaver armeniacum]